MMTRSKLLLLLGLALAMLLCVVAQAQVSGMRVTATLLPVPVNSLYGCGVNDAPAGTTTVQYMAYVNNALVASATGRGGYGFAAKLTIPGSGACRVEARATNASNQMLAFAQINFTK